MNIPQKVLDAFGFYVLASEWEDCTEIGSVVNRSEIDSTVLPEGSQLAIIDRATEVDWRRQCEFTMGRVPFTSAFYWKAIAE